MTIILGIESTAHTFGIGIVKDGEILANVKRTYTTEKGGIIPIEAAKHHQQNKSEIYFEALEVADIEEKEIDAIAFSEGPGLAPCLLEGMRFAKELSKKFKLPLIRVNHCVAHLEIGRLTGVKDSEAGSPVMLYASGANTQIIAYEAGKYRVFGETLDIGVGNFIDTFARYAGIGFPGGSAIEKLANGGNYIELPYKVKGMDIALSGILTNLKQKIEKMPHPPTHNKSITNINNINKPITNINKPINNQIQLINNPSKSINNNKLINKKFQDINYTLFDLAYSMQETVFAMLVETAERALAHTGKKELLLGGGVACNSRLQEMCKIMCKERGAKFFCPPNNLLTDNGFMIAYTGEIMFKAGIKETNLDAIDIKPRQRTDEVEVSWK